MPIGRVRSLRQNYWAGVNDHSLIIQSIFSRSRACWDSTPKIAGSIKLLQRTWLHGTRQSRQSMVRDGPDVFAKRTTCHLAPYFPYGIEMACCMYKMYLVPVPDESGHGSCDGCLIWPYYGTIFRQSHYSLGMARSTPCQVVVGGGRSLGCWV